MADHFPTFSKAYQTTTRGIRIVAALHTERGLLRAALYILLGIAILAHVIAHIPWLSPMMRGNPYGGPYGPGPYGGSDAYGAILLGMILSAAWPFPMLMAVVCLVTLLVTCERPRPPEVEPQRAEPAGQLRADSFAPNVPRPEPHPLDPAPGDPPIERRWTKSGGPPA